MTGTLEGRYRRLLAVYPAGHRRQHQDEMLGVLMTGARAGQRWPRLTDAADLPRRRPADPAPPGARRGRPPGRWADALAVTSVVLPLIVLAYLAAENLATLAIVPRAAGSAGRRAGVASA